MDKIFKDSTLQNNLDRDGFVILKGFFNHSEVNLIKEKYITLSSIFDSKSGLRSNVFVWDKKRNNAANEFIKKMFELKLSDILENYLLYGGCYITKSKSKQDNKVELHQDWTLTGEKHRHAFLIWSPMVDVSTDNGCFTVIPGSHRVFEDTLRSYHLPSLNLDFEKKEIHPLTLPLPMEKGDAIFYTLDLFHGSYPNLSNERRIAVSATILHKDTIPVYYHYDKQNSTLLKYQIGNDFHLNKIKEIFENKINWNELVLLDKKVCTVPIPTQDDFIKKFQDLSL